MFTKSNKSRRSVSDKHYDYRNLNSSSETSSRANEAKPDDTRENIVAALLAIPHEDIKYPILFDPCEPWEKFQEKVKECVKEKTFSFTLSYIWKEANVSLTKDSWGAFTHYINTQCSNHTVHLEMKCTSPSLKERIMFQGAAGQAKSTDLTVSDDSLTNGQDAINHLDQNGWKDENICQISKTGKMAAFRILSSSLLKEIRCQICNNRHFHTIVSERTIDPKLEEQLTMLCSKSEMRNFFDKRNQLM